VWVREKQPSMFMRNEMRNFLLDNDVDITSMNKGPLVDCWGKDIF